MAAGQGRHLGRVVEDEHRPPQLGLGGLLVDLEDDLARSPALVRLDARRPGRRPQLLDRHPHVDVHPRVLLHQVGEGGPPPGRGEVELPAAVGEPGRPQQDDGQLCHQLLGEGHEVGVVGVGLVELEHGELGVVAGGDALVAEHPSDLEHLLEAAHHQPLQVELGGDAQVEVEVEGVVVADEGLGQGPAGDGVEDRRLHLHEAPVLQPAAEQADHPAAEEERGAGLLGDEQVDVALAVAGVGVGQSVPLVGERAAGRGQERPVVDPHRQLAPPGGHDLARDPDPVAEREGGEPVEPGGGVGAGEELDAAAGVGQGAEGDLALVSAEHQPSRHRGRLARLDARRQRRPPLLQVGRGVGALEPVGHLRGARPTANW